MSRDSKDVKNLVLNVLPDNRPVTSLQIVEAYEKCPKNFTAIHRTYDQDADADLYREKILIAKKRHGRYLCLSKSEGLPEYIVETLKVIAEREIPPEGFSLLSRTADTEQKAWRKRQIAYKLSKRGAVTQAVTDIILCSRLKTAPEGFKLAGEINGIVVCFKLGAVTHRPPPQIPLYNNNKDKSINELESSLHYVNISAKPLFPLPPKPESHDYEEISSAYRLNSPVVPFRGAPRPPPSLAKDRTLGAASTEFDGVPFALNPNLCFESFEMPRLPDIPNLKKVQYDFHLERQVLCTTKVNGASATSKNPFFQ